MTVGEVFSYVDGIKPNAFDTVAKTLWLNEVEGLVQTEVMLLGPADVLTYAPSALWQGTGIVFTDDATAVLPYAPGFCPGGRVKLSCFEVYEANNGIEAELKAVSADGRTLTFAAGTFVAWNLGAETAAATLTYDNSGIELLVGAPHHKIYYTYLLAMIDFANGEYERYRNSMALFNAFFTEFRRWFAQRYRPADSTDKTLGCYLSAYGIAVKNGFCGTEAEFLQSLRGRDGVGIADFRRTAGDGTSGSDDTYTVTMTDGTAYSFSVHNGSDAEGGV